MNKLIAGIACALIAQSIAQVAVAEDEFHGIIESRPDAKAGTWVVGGRSINVTENTKLDEDHGPLNAGACVEVELESGPVEVAEKIESEPPSKCEK